MFSLGDIIICVDVRQHPADLLALPLKKDQEYECLGLKKCTRCGAQFVDIGLSVSSSRFDIVCNCQNRFNDGIWWFSCGRFRRKDQRTEEYRELLAIPTSES